MNCDCLDYCEADDPYTRTPEAQCRQASFRSPAGSTARFEREDRYLVIKREDIEKSLTPTEQNILTELAQKIDRDRTEYGHGGLQYVVVERDWPEYEPTWAAIQKRVEGR